MYEQLSSTLLRLAEIQDRPCLVVSADPRGISRSFERATSLHFELNEFEALRAGVLDRTRLACVLPDEVPIIGRHPASGIAGDDFRQHASMHIHAQTRRGLGNLACGLAGLQNHW